MSTQTVDRDWVPAVTFPARLAIVRNRMGWNAKEAALACGFPAQTWRNWEAGKKPHDYEGACARISNATGCSLAWLMGGAALSGGPKEEVSANLPSEMSDLVAA